MGQYYKGIILVSDRKNYPNKEKINASITAWDFDRNGAKLMEHSYINNCFVGSMEELINKEHGKYSGFPIVWGGDYADEEPLTLNKEKVTLYSLADDYGDILLEKDVTPHHYRYIINEDKGLFVDTAKVKADTYGLKIHPLPLLCCEGNGRGGGDYWGDHMELIGTWARDVIVTSDNAPSEEYVELVPNFKEDR